MKIQELKQQLNRVFDDDLHTRQWENFVDYTIIVLIVLSTLQIYLSTFDYMDQHFGALLKWIDYITIIVFTIEVTLRIWCADLLDEKYRGFMGRVRYCFSFYGFIDFVSTYSFYIALFFPIPYNILKVLRVARLLRIFRYMKAFTILNRAISSKKDEMTVSLQFLIIITLMLSFILFFVEHEAQPDVYNNGWTSVVWAFAQYIGDPGGFADTPPITFTGRIIACIIGVLGIAIFAVPAGLIASGFSDAMADMQREEELERVAHRIHLSFERKLDRPTGYQIAPKFVSMVDLQARMGLKADDVIDAVQSVPYFRLTNTAIMRTQEEKAEDKLAVEHFPVNTAYGCLIDRGSKVTIFTPSNITDPVCGWWGYYLAKIGNFNFISRELGETRPYRSFYNIDPAFDVPGLKEFKEDMNRLLDSDDKWVFSIMATSGMNTPEYPTQFHFSTGGKKGDETYESKTTIVHDIETFDAMYKDFAEKMSQLPDNKYDDGRSILCDHQKYQGSAKSQNFARSLAHHPNAVSLYVAWRLMAWDTRCIQLADILAHTIHNHIIGGEELVVSKEMKKKDIGYDGYKEFMKNQE